MKTIRQGFSTIELLTGMLITATLSTMAMDVNKEVLDASTSFTTQNTLQADTTDAFLETSELAAGNMGEVIEDTYYTDDNIVSIETTECSDGQQGFKITTVNQDPEVLTFATLNSCSRITASLKPIISTREV